MTKSYWLVKQEPEDYSWGDFVKEGEVAWSGVRNFQARNHLRAMKTGDIALFYHSGKDKQAMGLARVVREAYPDPAATEGDWSAVDMKPLKPLNVPVPLARIKTVPELKDMAFLRQSRLSVSPVTPEQFAQLLFLAGRTVLP
jgi:predicted RNA-binding protein with PUA-like domain